MAEEPKAEASMEDVSSELKALRDGLAGVLEAQKAHNDRDEESRNRIVAEYEAKLKAEAGENAPPLGEDALRRSDLLVLKEGTFNFGAMVNGVTHGNRFGFADACIRGAKKGTQAYKDAAFTAEMVLKQMSTTAASGGYLVPEEWSTQMIEQLYAGLVTGSAGVRRMSGLSRHTVRQPALTGSATMYWVAENGTVTASTQTDAQKTLQPNEAAVLVKTSNQLLDLSDPSAGQMIQTDMTQVLQEGVDLAVLRGAGSSNEPTGIANTSSINTVVASSGALSWALLEDFPYALAADNALKGKLAFVMNPRTVHNVKQLTSANRPLFVGSPYTEPIAAGFAGGSLVGYPVYQSTAVPITGGTGTDEAEVYFCNWDDVILADWGPLELAASTESDTAFVANQTWIRALWLVDVMVRHPVSCCLCTDTTS